MTPGLGRALLLLGALVAAPLAAPVTARGDPPPSGAAAFEWLFKVSPSATEAKWAPGLTDAERALAAKILPSCLALAVGPAGEKPFPTQVAGAGFVAGPGLLAGGDGLLVTARRVLSRMREGEWLWARCLGGEWARAMPLGSTWWGDVGVARLPASAQPWKPVAWGEADQQGIGRRFLAVGSPLGRTHVVSAGLLSSMLSFDPDAPTGLTEIRHRIGEPGKRSSLIGLRFSADLSTEGGAGSPVFDEAGACVGLVAGGDVRAAGDGTVFVRPAALLKPLVDSIVKQSCFNPPDLGATLGPPPGAPLPPDLEAARKRAKGGALVEEVVAPGPSSKLLWEGDVLLEVDGRPVFGEIYESLALALLRLEPGVPCDVVLLRGGSRKSVQVTPLRARSIYPDFAATHAARSYH